MFGLGIGELVVILAVVLLLFGPSRISKVMGDLGKGVKAFKQGLQEPSMASGESPEQGPSSTDKNK